MRKSTLILLAALVTLGAVMLLARPPQNFVSQNVSVAKAAKSFCGDGICDIYAGENTQTCPQDCFTVPKPTKTPTPTKTLPPPPPPNNTATDTAVPTGTSSPVPTATKQSPGVKATKTPGPTEKPTEEAATSTEQPTATLTS